MHRILQVRPGAGLCHAGKETCDRRVDGSYIDVQALQLSAGGNSLVILHGGQFLDSWDLEIGAFTGQIRLARPGLLDAEPAESAESAEPAEPDAFELGTPRGERRCGFAIEDEFDCWTESPKKVTKPPGAVSPAPAGASYDLSPRSDTPVEKTEAFQLEEEENAYLSAVQLLKEMGSGRAEAEVAWKTCVLREKLRLARSLAASRTPPLRRSISRESGDTSVDDIEAGHVPEDLELCPADWPEQKFRPLGVDFSFNFAALEMAEQEYEAEARALLREVLSTWQRAVRSRAMAR
ncbi:unnamed protein product [Symbiodinium natans]|uniref:Uncharacterized protein n=1 Tax=Symbiodinium natans TaxID=878477 RepID=A0A812LYC9_9DINO|nr:unnamed protein product [Symbiodinium natans]